MKKKRRISLKSKLILFIILILFFSSFVHFFIDYESSSYFNMTLDSEIKNLLDDIKKNNKSILQIASNLYIDNVMKKSTSVFDDYVNMTKMEFYSGISFYKKRVAEISNIGDGDNPQNINKSAIYELLDFLKKTNFFVDFAFYIDKNGEVFNSPSHTMHTKGNEHYIKQELKKLSNLETGYFYLDNDKDELKQRYLILDTSLNQTGDKINSESKSVLGLAFNMDNIVNLFFKYNNKYNGYGFLVNEDGSVVWDDGYTKEKINDIQSNSISDTVENNIKKQKGILDEIKKLQLTKEIRSHELNYNGTDYFLYSCYIKNLDVYYLRAIKVNDFLGRDAVHFRDFFRSKIDKIQQRFKNLHFNSTLLYLYISLSILCVCLFVGIKFIDKILRPISLIIEITKKIGAGSFTHKLSIHSAKEIQDLVDNFNLMTDNLKLYRERFKKSVLEKERIVIDLKLAGEIQQSFLPISSPCFPVSKKIELFAELLPAKYVSGDFYEYYFISDTRLFFAIGDISGKGVPAALFMMAIKTLFMKTNLKPGSNIADLVGNVNNLLCENNYSCMFATVCCGIIDTNTKKLALCNCGHTMPIIYSDGYYKFLQTEINPMIGAFQNIVYKSNSYDLSSGDILFLYSDGVIDIRNYKEKELTEEDLLSYLNREKINDTEVLIGSLKAKVIELSDNNQYDDMTMLCIKIL